MQSLPYRFANCLDFIIDRLAQLLSKLTPLAGAGFFYEPQMSSFWDAWTENGNTVCVRIGRFEFCASMNAHRGS